MVLKSLPNIVFSTVNQVHFFLSFSELGERMSSTEVNGENIVGDYADHATDI